MEAWAVAVVVLLAVLVGATLPVLYQLGVTLRSARRLLDRTGPKVEAALDDLHRTTERLNRMGAGLEESLGRAQSLLDAAGDIGRTLHRMRRSLRVAAAVGSAVGPAVAAAVKAAAERRRETAEAAPTDHGPDSTEETDHEPSQ